MSQKTVDALFMISFTVFFIPGLLYFIIELQKFKEPVDSGRGWGLVSWFVIGFVIYLIADANKLKAK